MPSMNRSMSVPDTGSMWDMHTSASQPSGTLQIASGCACACTDNTVSTDTKITQFYFHVGGEASLWDITMNPSTQGPTLEQLQKVGSVVTFSASEHKFTVCSFCFIQSVISVFLLILISVCVCYSI